MKDQETDRPPTAQEEEPSSAPFDPYRFQTMEVSTDLRRELTGAKLPRLDAKFFDDTNPEERAVAPARPRRAWHGITLVVGALVLFAVAFALHHSRGGRDAPPASSVR